MFFHAKTKVVVIKQVRDERMFLSILTNKNLLAAFAKRGRIGQFRGRHLAHFSILPHDHRRAVTFRFFNDFSRGLTQRG